MTRLRVRQRPEASPGDPRSSSADWNLFCRLVPSVAQQLFKEALERRGKDHADWEITPDESSLTNSGVEFLPLSITLPSGEVVYASYNGGDVSENNLFDTRDCIEIPASLVPNDCSYVHVTALPTVSNAKELRVEPLTVEDWVLLEANAAWLEDGGLLQQVTIVYPNQRIPIWVGGKDVANIRVLDSNFCKNSIWPDSDDAARPCLRLVADTQLIVAPKGQGDLTQGPKLRLAPTLQDYTSPMCELADRLDVALVDVPQRSVVVNPKTLARLPGPKTLARLPGWSLTEECKYAELRAVRNDSSEETAGSSVSEVVQILTSESVSENFIAIHPLLRRALTLDIYTDQVIIRLLSLFEIDGMAETLASIVLNRQATLGLVPVLMYSQRGSSWRFPDTLPTKGTPEAVRNRETYLEPEMLEPPASCAGSPLAVGSVMLLPWAAAPEKDSLLYRLVLEWNRDEPTTGATNSRCLIVLAQDLLPLLIQSVSARRPSESAVPLQAGIVTDRVVESPCLINLLPKYTVIPSALLVHTSKCLSPFDTLICGERGSGKTHTASTIASAFQLEYGRKTLYLDCKKLKESRMVRMKDVLYELCQVFGDAQSSPSVVILDDLDELAPNFEEDSGMSDDSTQVQQISPAAIDQSKLIADHFCHLLRIADEKAGELTLVVTCRDATSISHSLLSARLFADPVRLPMLAGKHREDLFCKLLKASISCPSTQDIAAAVVSLEFAKKTEGFLPIDIHLLVTRVQHQLHAHIASEVSFASAIECVLGQFVPRNRLSASTEDTHSGHDWNSVGGLFRVKRELASTLLRPSIYRRIYRKARIRLPRGILLLGLPGCGKSYLVPALAKECGYPLIMCRGPELLDKYIGASETKVRELFARAASVAPSILFLDELDSLAPRRGSDHTGVTDRIVNQLLTFLDGVEEASPNGTVYIVAATSRPDKVDPALLRPGRLEKHIYIGFPEEADEWTDLFMKTSMRYNLNDDALQYVSSGLLVEDALELCPHFLRMTPADVLAVFGTAQVLAAHEALAAERPDDKVRLGMDHLVEALQRTRPSLSREEAARLGSLYSPFRKNAAQPSDGDAASPRTRAGLHQPSLRVAFK